MIHERPVRPIAEYLGRLAWTLLLFNAFLALAGWLLARHLGARWALGLFVGTALLTTAALLLVVAANMLYVWLHGHWERRHRA